MPDETGNHSPDALNAPDEPTQGISSDQRERDALLRIVASLQPLIDNDVRERVLCSAAAFFRINLGSSPQSFRAPTGYSQQTGYLPPGNAFSEDRTISAKDFLIQKQPRTEVERVACLAYYLTHYIGTKAFKTIDISKLNTDAAQPKFVNASQAVENATKTLYLAAAARGNKQLSAAGEVFVQALPDRDSARAAMASMKPRRRKKSLQEEETEVDGGNNK